MVVVSGCQVVYVEHVLIPTQSQAQPTWCNIACKRGAHRPGTLPNVDPLVKGSGSAGCGGELDLVSLAGDLVIMRRTAVDARSQSSARCNGDFRTIAGRPWCRRPRRIGRTTEGTGACCCCCDCRRRRRLRREDGAMVGSSWSAPLPVSTPPIWPDCGLMLQLLG